MEILKTATEWAKAEVFSSLFFVLFGLMFVAATIGFWQLGKTDMARAFIFPTLVAGLFLLAVGVGLFFTNKSRLADFPTAYKEDASAFVQSEIVRAERTLGEYRTVVFTAFPILTIIASLIILFVDKPIWRAIGVTLIALVAVIALVDSNANARMEAYNQELLAVEQPGGN